MPSSLSVDAPKSDDTPRFRSLARLIGRGDCILVLGPGAATAPDSTPDLPLTVVLSQLLAQDGRVARTEGLDRRDLRHVSQVLYEATRSLTGLQETVAEFYARYGTQTSAFHRNVAALPFRFFLTTTPDDLLFNALTEAGKKPTRHYYSFRRARRTDAAEPPTVAQPLVYHLYGHHEEPDSLVITETDLIDFLAKVILNAPPLDPLIRAELAKASTTCLFVDLGFKDWYLRALLRALGLYGHQDTSIAVEDAEFFERSALHQTTIYFSASQAIQFHHETLDDFSTRLRQAHESLAAQKPREIATPAADAPCVFLSYVHEDREAADRLADNLRAAAINVWQDHQSLRVGDRWSQLLEQVINKQADYVAVMQSPNLAKRVETYVGIEVDQALKRHQKMTLGGFRFILPLRLGVRADLPTLELLQGIDVSTGEGVGALVTAINQDWAKRALARAAAPVGSS
jgi:TIR domain/SIR2-like domain